MLKVQLYAEGKKRRRRKGNTENAPISRSVNRIEKESHEKSLTTVVKHTAA